MLGLVLVIISVFPFSLQNEIFYQSTNYDSRIIGGNPAHIALFPFVAAINVEAPGSTWFCGGTLYGNEWIITAGQCVDGATHFNVRLGSVTLNGTDENRVTVSTSTYFLHPEYNSQTLENDIGMIRLHMPISFTDYIKSVTYLPINELWPNTQVWALGWGQTSDEIGALSNELQVAIITTLTNEECQVTYGSQIKDTMVCVVGSYNEGACHGDTGTGLILLRPRGYTELVGIASFISGFGCETPDPSGYTRVYPHMSWINDVVNNNIHINKQVNNK